MNSLQISAPAAVLVPALAIWLYAGWLSWSNWRRSARGRAVGRLECLRFLLVTLLVFTLLRPEFVQHLQRTLTPEIAVLIDASDSMKTRVEEKVRRHLMRARGRRGFGWTRWSSEWLYGRLGLFNNYKLIRWSGAKVAPAR